MMSPLVDAGALSERLDQPDTLVVDATWHLPGTGRSGQEDYDAGHIPGAVRVPLDAVSDPDADLPNMAADPIRFASAAKRLGIGDGMTIIAYDQNSFLASARLWWLLRLMGHKRVQVLDGGMAAWRAAGGAESREAPLLRPRHFTPRRDSRLVADMAAIQAATEDETADVVDARPAARFRGEADEPRAGLARGHIPTSVSVPYKRVLAANGSLDLAAARKLLPQGAPVIASCGSGVSAAVIALAYAALGRDDVAVYDGSWAEYGASGAPVATPG